MFYWLFFNSFFYDVCVCMCGVYLKVIKRYITLAVSPWHACRWKRVNCLHWTPLKIKILKIGLRQCLSWPKLSLEPKCHDPGTFFTFFCVLDRLKASKKMFTKCYFYLKRVQKMLTTFFLRATPLKMGFFFKMFFFFLHL